ncbi:hypothetical protein AC579_5984 [Pseudocercospora musae]|uniref:Uncharacterized protein n=1 Tax=Pseudocercospora musae TaxID=113226 RepID=A0A139I405_9PEZI|nr:hypothetical protein AC579_5984 [Pseudocercospora musae]
MTSHVPFLAVRPDAQYSSEITTRDFADTNGIIDMQTARGAPAQAAQAASHVPTLIKFPLLVLLTFSLSSLLYSLVADFTGPELASVSRDLSAGWHIAVMVGWKLVELGIAWYMRFDYSDLAWLTLLSNVPHYFLLNTFYGIDYLAAVVPLFIDVSTIAIPFALLRGMNRARDTSAPKTVNQAVAQDTGIQWVTGLLGASLYALVIYGSFYTWLPQYMVVHFDGLRSVQKAHDTTQFLLLAVLGPVGYATTQFIFVPAIGSAANPGLTDPKLKPEKVPFNPETATFSETLAWNLGFSEAGFSHRAEILAKRTFMLAASAFINTFIRAYVTIEGTEIVGAIGWASVWSFAAGLTGFAFSWVGDE